MRRSKQKPLEIVRHGRLKAAIYRARFRSFVSTKYFNVAALKKAKKVPIQIGMVEAAGKKVTIEAEVSKGLITKIRPVGCENCEPPKSKGKVGKGAYKKLAHEALQRVRALGKPGTALPVPISQVSNLQIGPIIIMPWDICIKIDYTDGWSCWYCIFLPTICIGPVILN